MSRWRTDNAAGLPPDEWAFTDPQHAVGRMPKTLNSKWANDTITASGFPVARAAKITVTVVPTLVPIV